MQKISTYLYPNRIQLLADLAGYPTEYTNVYQRIIKIYQGVDNILEFDVKNADQKRIDISTLSNVQLNLMDSEGNELGTYDVIAYPQDTPQKGLGYVNIPCNDLLDLEQQFLRYSITHSVNCNTQLLYGDSRFGATGTIELITTAMPTTRKARVLTSYAGEIDLNGNVINHFSAIPAKFYEAVKTTQLTFDIDVTGFIGTIWLQATTNDTISVDSFKYATHLASQTLSVATTTTVTFSNVDINDFAYFRVSFQGDNPLTPTGTVDKVTVS